MTRDTEGNSGRWLRLLIVAPAVVLGGVALSFSLGTSSASADETPTLGGAVTNVLGDTTDLVGGLIDDTTTTVTGVTTSATKVVTTVVAPPAKKPVTAIVTSVVDVVPATTTTVTSTVAHTLDNTSSAVETVATEVVPAVLDPVVSLASRAVDDTVAAILPRTLAPVVSVPVEASTTVVAPQGWLTAAATPPATPLATAAASAHGESPAGQPSAPTPLGIAPAFGSAGSATSGFTLLTTLTPRTTLGAVATGISATTENDELPSTPTFDTDTSPD
jgi:hypothetical protein